MNDRIFIESNEDMGLLYNRYHKLPDKVKSFIDDIEEQVTRINKEGIEEAIKHNESLQDKIQKFKKDVEVNIKNPDVIYSDDLKEEKQKLKACRDMVENQMNRLAKLRHSCKWGDHYLNGILFRSKILHHKIDAKSQDDTNMCARTVTRALDWAEKVTLDLLNLTSQDMNILMFINKVYYRTIFEHGELNINLVDDEDMIYDDIMECEIIEPWTSIFTESGDEDDENKDEDDDPIDELENMDDEDGPNPDNEEDDGKWHVKKDPTPIEDEDDIMNITFKDGDEKYCPIYCVAVAGDPVAEYEQDKNTHKQKTRAKTLTNITRGERHNHALIGFDPSMEHMYSFDATHNFHEDNMILNELNSTAIAEDIYVSVTFLTEQEVADVKQAIIDYNNNHVETKYNLKQLVAQIFGKAEHLSHSQVCSTFVGYLLNVANPKNIHRDYSMIRPEDVTLLPRSFHVISFKNQQDLRNRVTEIATRTKEIYDANIDEIREYNNELPKVLVKHQMKEHRFIDKIFGAFTRFA